MAPNNDVHISTSTARRSLHLSDGKILRPLDDGECLDGDGQIPDMRVVIDGDLVADEVTRVERVGDVVLIEHFVRSGPSGGYVIEHGIRATRTAIVDAASVGIEYPADQQHLLDGA